MSDIRARGDYDFLVKRLRWVVKLCKRMHIANGSRLTYATGQRTFLRFCEAFDKDPWAVNEDDLCLAAVYFTTDHTVKSVPSYFSAVQNLWDAHGLGELPRGPGFHLTMKGLHRLL